MLVEIPGCQDTLWKWKATKACNCMSRSWQWHELWNVFVCVCLWDIESYVVCGCVRGVPGLLANFLQLHKYVSDCMYIRLKAVYFESKLQHLASCCVNGACFIMLPKSAYDKVCWACYCSLSLCTDHKSHLKVPIIAYWFKCVDTVLAEARKAVWFHIIGCIYGLEFIF